MLKKAGIVGTVVAMCAVAFGLGVSSAGAGISGPVEITVVEHATTDKVVDVGRKGDSTGDVLTFHNEVYDEDDVSKIGAVQGLCTRMSPKQGTWECSGTTSLEGGQITFEGPFFDDTNTVLAAVNGGTGVYENARGTMEASCTDSGCTMTYDLIP